MKLSQSFLLTLYIGVYTLLKERKKRHADEEQEVSMYWMNLRIWEVAGNWKRKHRIVLCGEFALEEAMDLLWADYVVMLMNMI
jgi:hypothetical protein